MNNYFNKEIFVDIKKSSWKDNNTIQINLTPELLYKYRKYSRGEIMFSLNLEDTFIESLNELKRSSIITSYSKIKDSSAIIQSNSLDTYFNKKKIIIEEEAIGHGFYSMCLDLCGVYEILANKERCIFFTNILSNGITKQAIIKKNLLRYIITLYNNKELSSIFDLEILIDETHLYSGHCFCTNTELLLYSFAYSDNKEYMINFLSHLLRELEGDYKEKLLKYISEDPNLYNDVQFTSFFGQYLDKGQVDNKSYLLNFHKNNGAVFLDGEHLGTLPTDTQVFSFFEYLYDNRGLFKTHEEITKYIKGNEKMSKTNSSFLSDIKRRIPKEIKEYIQSGKLKYRIP